jgi:hypothetical protein
MLPIGSSRPRLLNQSTHSSVAYSTASKERQGPRPMDDLGLVEAVDGLGQGVVVAVADAADRGFDPALGQPLAILDRHILGSAVGVVDEAAAVLRATFVQGLFESVEHEAGVGGAADPPADDLAGVPPSRSAERSPPRLRPYGRRNITTASKGPTATTNAHTTRTGPPPRLSPGLRALRLEPRLPAQQHDPGAPNVLLGAVPVRQDRAELAAVGEAYVYGDACPHPKDSHPLKPLGIPHRTQASDLDH